MQEKNNEAAVEPVISTDQPLGDVDIVVQNADIGNFNLVVWATITVICVIYFFTHLTP